MHQNRSISLFSTPFGHFHFHPFPALIWWVDLRRCHTGIRTTGFRLKKEAKQFYHFRFSKVLEIVFAVFSYPLMLLPDWMINTRWSENILWKWRKTSGRKCFSLMETNPHHSCNQCGYSSVKTAILKKHMLVHSGEKPFSCRQCNYSCKTAGQLKRHMLTHSGGKPFTCTECNFSYTTASCLREAPR